MKIAPNMAAQLVWNTKSIALKVTNREHLLRLSISNAVTVDQSNYCLFIFKTHLKPILWAFMMAQLYATVCMVTIEWI